MHSRVRACRMSWKANIVSMYVWSHGRAQFFFFFFFFFFFPFWSPPVVARSHRHHHHRQAKGTRGTSRAINPLLWVRESITSELPRILSTHTVVPPHRVVVGSVLPSSS
ncbi:hypothetical protein IWX91DRAFT_124458 [Phyllosticta citricarpa]